MDIRGTIFQPWNWYTPMMNENNENLWKVLKKDAKIIRKNGFTAVWLPPASLGVDGKNDVGYGVKNWYELDGTKYGNKIQLKEACQAFHQQGIQIYFDQVYNHLMGGDIQKNVWCRHVTMNNKNIPLGDWLKYDIHTDFPWLKLDYNHFDAYHPDSHTCWILKGKSFDTETNPDPLMGCDLDFDNIDLVKKVEKFGIWFKNEVLLDGYRFDAVKHIRPKGIIDFLHVMRISEKRNLFAVGEYLDENLSTLHGYITQTYGQISLFDFPLQRKLVHASREGNRFDMASLGTKTLTSEQPTCSVTFVHSHDDQPGMHGFDRRGEYIGDWFISQAYAFILLRDEGYPMVSNVDILRHPNMIKRYMLVRNNCTFGSRYDSFDHNNTIGWSFSGGFEFDNSMAVVITNGEYGYKWLETKKPNTCYRDLTDALKNKIYTNEYGWGNFECPSRNTSVWVEESKYFQLINQID